MFYPLKFYNIYKDYIWGGRNLQKIGKELPETGNVAESWELSAHENGLSKIKNGEYEGLLFKDFIEKFGQQAIGRELDSKFIEKFPLLIKFIDANDRLSVQVHPNDEYAYINENGELGKNEMWYIIHAEPGAKLVAGLASGVDKAAFEKSIKDGTLESCMNFMPVETGDFLNIPCGMVHAIGKGIIIAEVQQSSNTTYRVYDYNRIGADGKLRELHIDKALDVIDFSITQKSCHKSQGIQVDLTSKSNKNVKIANKYFCIEMYDVNDTVEENADGSKFYVYMICSGSGRISYEGGCTDIKSGETIFIPASLGRYTLEGNFKAVKAFVPDIDKDVVEPLKKLGHSIDEISAKVDGLNQ